MENGNTPPDNDATGDIMSWVITFILLVAFWPLGLLMLLKKLNVIGRSSAGSAKSSFSDSAANGRHSGNFHSKNSARHHGNTGNIVSSELAQAAREIKFAAQQAVSELYADFKREFDQSSRQQPSGQGARHHGQQHDYQQQASQERRSPQGEAETEPLRYNNANTREYSEPRDGGQAEQKRSPVMPEKKSAKLVSVISLLISVALLIFGVNTIIPAARDILISGINSWFDFSLGLFYLAGACILFFSRNIAVRRGERYKRLYAYACGRGGAVSIPEAARVAGISVRRAERDLTAMVNEGYFGQGAYIDKKLSSLIMPGYTAEKPAGAAAEDRRQENGDTPANQYMAVILELRGIYSTIADVSISGKVYRIEELAAKIFRIVEENPEKQPMIRRFMGYYMPTTIKLLRSYSVLEKQGVQGENITGAKESIERVLDTLITGFEQQLDQLFSADAIDIAADINVLEHLMQQDGLKDANAEKNTMEGVS